jgi:DNA-3-methyladenine glycosylase II
VDSVTVSLSFELAAVPPFRLDLTAWALRRRPENHVDRWDGTTYSRAVHIDKTPVEITVRQHGSRDAPTLAVSVAATRPVPADRAQREVAELLRRVLGLDVDTTAFTARVSHDPAVGPLARRFAGLKPPRLPTVFECLVNAIACQQFTLTVGIMLLDRLAHAHGATVPAPAGGTAHAFPEPGDLANVEPEVLGTLGFSRAKARAVTELARRVTDGDVDLAGLERLGDKTAIARLLELRGIGRWSAEYVLLRGLGRVRVFPGDDVGARNNLARRLGIAGPLDYEAVRETTSRWDPFAGFVYFHLLIERIDAAGWLTNDAEHAVS